MGLATRRLGQHRINPHHIDGDGRRHMLHLRFVQAIIACASYAHPSHRLGKGPLDACSRLIDLPKRCCLLFLSPCLQGFMSYLSLYM